MLPKTQFHRSHIYDTHLKRPRGFKIPTDNFIYTNTSKLENKWRKIEKKILKELSFITKLRWRESHIYIYITGGSKWFSMPLTMSITNDIEALLDTLIHELIHRILSENENWPIIEKNWNKLMGKYKRETFNTRIHIPIHAIHKHLFIKFFDKRRMDKEISRVQHLRDYTRSWKIVERDGYESIIKELTNGIK